MVTANRIPVPDPIAPMKIIRESARLLSVTYWIIVTFSLCSLSDHKTQLCQSLFRKIVNQLHVNGNLCNSLLLKRTMSPFSVLL